MPVFVSSRRSDATCTALGSIWYSIRSCRAIARDMERAGAQCLCAGSPSARWLNSLRPNISHDGSGASHA